jgi:hypothetical protein
VLHDRHITDFSGTFEEWETVTKERAHAASVTAAEEESLRRMHEKQKTKRREDDRDKHREGERNARRKVDQAEVRVGELEAKITELTTALADPELYMSEAGKQRAVKAGIEMERLKKQLDKALDDWTAATEAVERSAASAKTRR